MSSSPGVDSSTPNLNDNANTGAADTASYRQTSDTRSTSATTRPAMQAETKHVSVEKQRDND